MLKSLFVVFFGLSSLLTGLSALAQPLTIVAVGDIMPGSAYPFSSELPPADGQRLLDHVQTQLGGADVVFGNLEGVLVDDISLVRPCPPTSTTCFRFGIPTRYTRHLKATGFTTLNIANNHIHDFEAVGRQMTLTALNREELVAFGTLERPSNTQILPNGIRIGWVGFAPHTGANFPSIDAIREQVSRLKQTHDLVFVSMHVGAEGSVAQHVTRDTELFLGQNRGNPYAFAHTAIDAGADLVLGHGPHVMRGLELYKGRLIAYSLGNFSTYGRFNLKGPNGLAGILRATLNERGEFLSGQFIGTRQDRLSPEWQEGITPILDTQREAIGLMQTLSRQDFPESPLQIQDDGFLVLKDQPAAPEPIVTPATTSKRPAAPTPPQTKTAARESRWGKIQNSFQSFFARSRDAIRNLARN